MPISTGSVGINLGCQIANQNQSESEFLFFLNINYFVETNETTPSNRVSALNLERYSPCKRNNSTGSISY